MGTATEQYIEKVQRLTRLISLGRQGSAAADALRAEIGVLWRSMTAEEQEQALKSTRDLLSGDAEAV